MIKDSQISPKAIEVCQILQYSGFQAYLVGGCVRDLLMGNKPKDWDIATNAKPEQTKNVFSMTKTYDTGLQHGTITVSMGDTVEDHFEVTTYRSEGEYSDGRRPDSVAFVDHIESDLARRDLTINAIAYDPLNYKLVDPFGGLEDLKNKVIRAVGNPNERFAEDGLRTMRVARFAARLGFMVDPGTEAAISNNLNVLSLVSRERMRDELTKTLVTSHPSVGLNILFKTGALGVVGAVYEDPDTFPQIDRCQGSMETKMAIMLYSESVKVIENALKDLKFSNVEAKKIKFLLSARAEFKAFANQLDNVSARRFLAFVKNNAPEEYQQSLKEFFAFAEAIQLDQISLLKLFLNEKVISRKELDISGNDLMEQLHVSQGPQIKKLLDSLYEEVILHPEMNEKGKLLEMAAKL